MSKASQFDDEEHELDRLLVKARPIKDDRADLQRVIAAIQAEQASLEKNDEHCAQSSFEKWRLLHKYLHARPFRLSSTRKRSAQWREVARICAPLEDRGLQDWLALQIDVAANRAQGIADLRIRRDGPCYLILLEYVSNKKRTALAVLHWAREE